MAEAGRHPMSDSPEPLPPSPARPAAGRLTYGVLSTAGLFLLYGLFIVGSALVELNRGPDAFARGPNVIIQDDQERSHRFYAMLSTVLGTGLALFLVGCLIALWQRWAVYLGFPVIVAAALILL